MELERFGIWRATVGYYPKKHQVLHLAERISESNMKMKFTTFILVAGIFITLVPYSTEAGKLAKFQYTLYIYIIQDCTRYNTQFVFFFYISKRKSIG